MAIPRINILQHRELGKKLIGWAMDPTSRPNNLEEFKQQTAGIIDQPLPPWIKAIQFIQPNFEVLVIRLAPPEFVKDSLEINATAGGPYPLPKFYEDFYLHGKHTNRQEMFEYRVGDYTLAFCM
jgi:hypothetical protein